MVEGSTLIFLFNIMELLENEKFTSIKRNSSLTNPLKFPDNAIVLSTIRTVTHIPKYSKLILIDENALTELKSVIKNRIICSQGINMIIF